MSQITSENTLQTPAVSDPSREQLISEIGELILNAVGLNHLDRTNLTGETSLRQGGLELDSVDILEVVVVIEQHYQVKVANAEMGAKYFKSIGTIADFVQLQKSSA